MKLVRMLGPAHRTCAKSKLLYYALRSVLYRGSRVSCPVCGGHFRKFLPFGVRERRRNARCPRCGSFERHRLLMLYLKERTNFFTSHLKVLEFAPHVYLQERLRRMKNLEYISADLASPLAMVSMDITDIKFEDNQFDCVICYHVLEHVPDDLKAMREICRILRPGAWGILQPPVDQNREKTFEDTSVVTPEARERLFGRFDHVRVYGRDYKERLESAGFKVRVDDFISELSIDADKYGLMRDEPMYYCIKPVEGSRSPRAALSTPDQRRARVLDRVIPSKPN